MPAPHQFLSMVLRQQLGRQKLERTPEPHQVTSADDSVNQYDQVMLTKLVVIYAAGLDVARAALPDPDHAGKAIDLACGPGHYTVCLAKYLGFESVLGVDLSEGMVEIANQNARKQGLAERVHFERRNVVTGLDDLPDNSFDFASFTGAAHHLDDIDAVSRTIAVMDRITRPGGLVMVMDLVRLRTCELTEDYVRLLGKDYDDRGLGNFFEQFRDTMYAVYTPDEFREAVPEKSERRWYHIVPRGLPSVQIVLGLPVGHATPFVRKIDCDNPLIRDWFNKWEAAVSARWARQTRNDCRLVRLGLQTARQEHVPKGDKDGA